MQTLREHHPYREAGLHRVILCDINVSWCGRCGKSSLGIQRRDLLHRVIAELLTSKPARLMGSEIRYLRRSVGLSETDLAKRVGVTIETVSRWEAATKVMRLPAERLLRLLVALELKIRCPVLEGVGTAPAEDLAVRLAWNGEDWASVA